MKFCLVIWWLISSKIVRLFGGIMHNDQGQDKCGNQFDHGERWKRMKQLLMDQFVPLDYEQHLFELYHDYS